MKHAPKKSCAATKRNGTACQVAVVPGSHIGHETASVSRNYTKIDDTAKRAAVNKLPDITK
jgi:hypothetical protein